METEALNSPMIKITARTEVVGDIVNVSVTTAAIISTIKHELRVRAASFCSQ